MRFRTVVLVNIALVLMVTLVNSQVKPQSKGSAVSQADNSYCGPGDTPSFGGAQDGPAKLPTACIYSALAGTPSPGNVVPLAAGGNLQTALNAAQCGDTITLQAGATFAGTFTLPAKSCDDQHWITIRTSTPDGSLPPEGTRATPCNAGVASLPGRPPLNCSTTQPVLATIANSAGTASGPIDFAPGANHYRLLGLEITRTQRSGGVINLVAVRYKGTADHIVIDRCWIHGTAQDDTGRGINLNGMTYVAAVDSFFSDLHCASIVGACSDAQAISGGGGSSQGGPYKIVDNFLEASSENVLFGGGPATATPGDIEIRRNHFFKPVIWRAGEPGYVGGPTGHPFTVKNHLELKNAQRVLFEGNVVENNWGGFSQSGFSILLTPKNQMMNGSSVCPICQVTDVTIRYSTISHSASGFTLATVLSGDGTGGTAKAGARYSIHDIIVDDIDGTKYNGGGTIFLILNTWRANVLNSVTVNHVTAVPNANNHLTSLQNSLSNPVMSGFNFTNNLMMAGPYPVWTAGGGGSNCAVSNVPLISLGKCFVPYSFSNNAIIGSPAVFPASKWPSGNYFPADTGAVEFVNYNNGDGGDYHLLPSSPFKNKGTDGRDLGADIDALTNAIAGVE